MKINSTVSGFLLICAGIILFFSVSFADTAENLRTFRDVETAYLLGQINRAEKLVRQMTLFFEPTELAAGAGGRIEVLKSGTQLIREVTEEWDLLSPQQQSLLAGLLSRPPMQYSYDSPGGVFRVHFSITGPDFVPAEDNNGNSIPDYVERVAEYCDSSYNVYIGNFGYLPPPSDNGAGGDDRYDVYLLALGGYGVTFLDSPGDSAWNDYSSYIGIHNNFYGFPPNDDPDGDTIGAQKVTCAHEYYHAVQLAYDAWEDLWWKEATAIWMEEVVYPGVNDNYNYLDLFFDHPDAALTSESDYHFYGAFVWPAFLQQKFDASIFESIWQACRYNEALAAIDSGLAQYGTSVNQVFPEFTVWNYMTGSRTVSGRYYESAAEYPEIVIDRSLIALPHDSLTPNIEPQGLGSSYFRYTVGGERGILQIRLDGAGSASWACSVVLSKPLSNTILFGSASPGVPIRFYIPYIEDFERAAVISAPLTPNSVGNPYYLTTQMHMYGDANADGDINIGDATYLTNHVFHDGPDPIPIRGCGDANCDGAVNIADAVYLSNFVFHSGPEPCHDR